MNQSASVTYGSFARQANACLRNSACFASLTPSGFWPAQVPRAQDVGPPFVDYQPSSDMKIGLPASPFSTITWRTVR